MMGWPVLGGERSALPVLKAPFVRQFGVGGSHRDGSVAAFSAGGNGCCDRGV
jgi:hypothetical protein